MILKALISLIFVGTAVLKLTGKVAPDWERWGYPPQFMYATGTGELARLALFWWPGHEILGAAGLSLVLLAHLQHCSGIVSDCPTLLSRRWRCSWC